MKVTSDDDLYRAKLIYLGPPGHTFPVHLTYVQYGLFAALFAVIELLALLIFGTFLVTGVCIAAAIGLTWFISQRMDPDQPARKVIKTLATDWQQSKSAPAGQVARFTADHITIRETITAPADGGHR